MHAQTPFLRAMRKSESSIIGLMNSSLYESVHVEISGAGGIDSSSWPSLMYVML